MSFSTSTGSNLTPSPDSASTARALPTRAARNADGTVWSLTPGPDSSRTSERTVASGGKCAQHDRERTVCCRTLKGTDERSLVNPDIVKDVIIGLSDGLTVPFALTAGLSSLGSSHLVVVAGIAELVSGAISMGVGGYLSAQAERDHYLYQLRTTRERVLRSCSGEMEREVGEILTPLGLDNSLCRRVAGALLSVEGTLPIPPPESSIFQKFLSSVARQPRTMKVGTPMDERAPLLSRQESSGGESVHEEKGLTAFLLKYGEGLEEVSESRLFISAFTIGTSYFLGGLVPLLPYFFLDTARDALYWSIGMTTIILLLFGAIKAYLTGAELGAQGYAYGCLSTLFVGGAAAGASFGIVKALEGSGL